MNHVVDSLAVSLLASAVLATFPKAAQAGPHEGGTLILHYNASLVYTPDTADYCGLANLPSCTDVVTRIDVPEPAVFYALAAFADGAEPRLSGLTFGIAFDDQVQVVDAGACGDFELADPDWPGTGTGTAVTWGAAQTSTLTEVYWFAAYSYVSEPQRLTLTAHPAQGGWFGDDSVPSQLDAIAGYGSMGFGTDGSVECPSLPVAGACCFPSGACSLLRESACAVQGGLFLGENTLCEPNPCAQPGACCYPSGVCEVVPFDLCFDTYLGDGSACDPNPCPQPGACCHPDGSCEQVLSGACDGVFQGEGTLCDPNPCPSPVGACCYADGHCETLTRSECANGSYQGDFTVCEPNPCAQPGACCYPDGHCEVVDEGSCGGAYQGNGTSCDPNPCPQPGACCYPDGHCEVTDEASCVGAYQGNGTSCDPNPCPQPTGACCLPGGACESLAMYLCIEQGGTFWLDVPCDPLPCEWACCREDGSCTMTDLASCTDVGGSFAPGLECDPNPCLGVGACCFGADCVQLTSRQCLDDEGIYFGEGVACEDVTCIVNDCNGNPFTLAELGFAGDLTEEQRPAASSTGVGTAVVMDSELDAGCGTLVFNADETYENGFAWPYGGTAPPCFGAFAEGYVGLDGRPCAAIFDFTSDVTQDGQVMDVYVWQDTDGRPGAVIAFETNVNPGPIAFWPSISRHVVPLTSSAVHGDFWVGYWGNWPGLRMAWYTAVDLDGPGGRPYTNVAPGIGYPTGWHNVEVVWGPAQALGIGVELTGTSVGACCLPSGQCVIRSEEQCAGDFLGAGTDCTPNECSQPPVGACCFMDGHCESSNIFQCSDAGGEYQGADTVCEPNPCPQPTGACCFIDGHCNELTFAECTNNEGVYQGDFSLCDPNPCPAPTGGCCLADGRCQTLTHDECDGAGGVYQGDGAPCEPNPCPQFPGACCLGDGNCLVLAEYLCADNGGSFLGADTSCEPNPCPQPGACCSFDGTCNIAISDSCFGEFQGEGTDCDPNPCPQRRACCFSGGCQLLTETECATQGGEYYPDQSCTPNPCQGAGACCVGPDCLLLTSGECFARGGVYLGEGVRCEDVICFVPDCSGGLFTLSELGFEGDLSDQPGDVAASTGAGSATPVPGEPAGDCGTLLFNANGTYENAFTWRYGGTATPCFGAFAEGYSFDGPRVCSVVFDFTTTGDLGANMDVFVFSDAGGVPGAVVYADRVDPGPIAFWPSVSRHTFAVHGSVCPGDTFWIGYWGNWPGDFNSWFVAADLDGFRGLPYTNIAPGIGYPTGWNHVSIVWGPTVAIGIGAEITYCGSTPIIDTTWGKIKTLFR